MRKSTLSFLFGTCFGLSLWGAFVLAQQSPVRSIAGEVEVKFIVTGERNGVVHGHFMAYIGGQWKPAMVSTSGVVPLY